MMQVHELAEKYLGIAVSKVCESQTVKVLLKLVYAVACALILQVVILSYVAYVLTSTFKGGGLAGGSFGGA